MERQAKDGTFYQKVGADEWSPVTRTAKDGTVYKKVGADEWTPIKATGETASDYLEPLVTAAESAGQELSLGYLPNIRAGINYAAGQATGQPIDYAQNRDQIKRDMAARADRNPIASGVGTGAGMLASMMIPGGVAAKGVSTAAKIGRGALAAGAMGAAMNPGETEGQVDPLQLGERATNAGIGLAGGAVLGTAGQMGAKALNKSSWSNGLKAAGPMLKDFRRIFGKGREQELGRFVVENKLAGIGDDFADVAMKSESLRERAGQKIGAIYNNVLDMLTSPQSPLTPQQAQKIIDAGFRPDAHKAQIMAELANDLKGAPNKSAVLSKIETYLDDLYKDYGSNLDMGTANQIKRKIDEQINWAKSVKDMPEIQQAYAKLRRFVSDRIDGQAEEIDKALGGQIGKELKAANKVFGNAQEVFTMAKDRELREGANRFMSPSDYWAGGIGSLIGAGAGAANASPEERINGLLKGAVYGAGAAMLNKGARLYGRGGLSQTQSAIANRVMPIAPGLSVPFMNRQETKPAPVQEAPPTINPVIDSTPQELNRDSGTPANQKRMPNGAKNEGPRLPRVDEYVAYQDRETEPVRNATLSALAGIDSVTGAPMRRTLSELMKGDKPGAVGRVLSQIGNSKDAPTWEDLASQAGIENETIKKVVGVLGPFIEPNLPLGTAMGMAKKVGISAKEAQKVIDFQKALAESGGPKPVDRIAQMYGETGKLIGVAEDTLPNEASRLRRENRQKKFRAEADANEARAKANEIEFQKEQAAKFEAGLKDLGIDPKSSNAVFAKNVGVRIQRGNKDTRGATGIHIDADPGDMDWRIEQAIDKADRDGFSKIYVYETKPADVIEATGKMRARPGKGGPAEIYDPRITKGELGALSRRVDEINDTLDNESLTGWERDSLESELSKIERRLEASLRFTKGAERIKSQKAPNKKGGD